MLLLEVGGGGGGGGVLCLKGENTERIQEGTLFRINALLWGKDQNYFRLLAEVTCRSPRKERKGGGDKIGDERKERKV